MRKVSSELRMEASPAQVWEVLSDFGSYPRWNPFITRIQGELRVGERLTTAMRLPGGREMVFHPRVLAATKERELRWLGKLFVGGVFDGEHHFWIDPLGDDAVVFHQDESFRGVLVPFTASLLERTARGFGLMNRALEAEVEARAARSGGA